MKKIVLSSTSILCLMAIYNVLVFCLCKNFTKNFWVSYALIMAAFTIMLVSFVISYAGSRSQSVTGLPITTLSVYYAIFELILASSLMFFNISFIAVFLPQIIIFLLFMAVYIPALIKYFSLPKNQPKNQPTEKTESN